MIENLRYLSTSILEVPNIKSNRGTTGFAKRGRVVCTQVTVFPLKAKRKNPGNIPSFVVNKPFNLGMDS